VLIALWREIATPEIVHAPADPPAQPD
jgi:hypothetical protein